MWWMYLQTRPVSSKGDSVKTHCAHSVKSIRYRACKSITTVHHTALLGFMIIQLLASTSNLCEFIISVRCNLVFHRGSCSNRGLNQLDVISPVSFQVMGCSIADCKFWKVAGDNQKTIPTQHLITEEGDFLLTGAQPSTKWFVNDKIWLTQLTPHFEEAVWAKTWRERVPAGSWYSSLKETEV